MVSPHWASGQAPPGCEKLWGGAWPPQEAPMCTQGWECCCKEQGHKLTQASLLTLNTAGAPG